MVIGKMLCRFVMMWFVFVVFSVLVGVIELLKLMYGMLVVIVVGYEEWFGFVDDDVIDDYVD